MNDAQQDADRFSTKAVEENFNKLKEKLRELFQLDRGDLDFGLYRVMALKRDEVNRFLDKDLLPQVTEALGEIAKSDVGVIEERLKKDSDRARELGYNPDESSTIQSLKAQLKAAENDQQREADTYNHLCNFFARHYDQGDFMSLRRYKSGGREAYSIPYNGEEVKLHWANSDQYYIKTTENYASYVFIVNKGGKDCRVRFEIADADNEKDNIKETQTKIQKKHPKLFLHSYIWSHTRPKDIGGGNILSYKKCHEQGIFIADSQFPELIDLLKNALGDHPTHLTP